MTKELDGRVEELHCIECDGVRNIELCKECRDVVCKGCMFNHNEMEREEALKN